MPPESIKSSNPTGRIPVQAALIACLISIALHAGIWYLGQNMPVKPTHQEKPPLVVIAALTIVPRMQHPADIPTPKPMPQQHTPALSIAKPKITEKATIKPKAYLKPKPLANPKAPKKAFTPSPKTQEPMPKETPSTLGNVTSLPVLTSPKTNQKQAQSSAPEPLVKAAYSAPGLKNPPTRYPRIAQMRGWEGTVTLDIRVLSNGSAGDVKIIQGSGHEILDESAVEQVKSWHFVPAHRGDKTVDDWVRIPISFKFKH